MKRTYQVSARIEMLWQFLATPVWLWDFSAFVKMYNAIVDWEKDAQELILDAINRTMVQEAITGLKLAVTPSSNLSPMMGLDEDDREDILGHLFSNHVEVRRHLLMLADRLAEWNVGGEIHSADRVVLGDFKDYEKYIPDLLAKAASRDSLTVLPSKEQQHKQVWALIDRNVRVAEELLGARSQQIQLYGQLKPYNTEIEKLLESHVELENLIHSSFKTATARGSVDSASSILARYKASLRMLSVVEKFTASWGSNIQDWMNAVFNGDWEQRALELHPWKLWTTSLQAGNVLDDGFYVKIDFLTVAFMRLANIKKDNKDMTDPKSYPGGMEDMLQAMNDFVKFIELKDELIVLSLSM